MLKISIRYATGEIQNTNLNPNTDQEFIKRYFRPGTVHNLGHVKDQILEIKSYEVKESQLVKLDETKKIALELAFRDYLEMKVIPFSLVEKIWFDHCKGLNAIIKCADAVIEKKSFTQCGFMDDRAHKYVRLGIKDILNERITGGFFSAFSLGMQTIIKEPQD